MAYLRDKPANGHIRRRLHPDLRADHRNQADGKGMPSTHLRIPTHGSPRLARATGHFDGGTDDAEEDTRSVRAGLSRPGYRTGRDVHLIRTLARTRGATSGRRCRDQIRYYADRQLTFSRAGIGTAQPAMALYRPQTTMPPITGTGIAIARLKNGQTSPPHIHENNARNTLFLRFVLD